MPATKQTPALHVPSSPIVVTCSVSQLASQIAAPPQTPIANAATTRGAVESVCSIAPSAMAEENQHAGLLQMREQLKQLYRARLPPDMGWCDDNTRRNQQVRVSDVSVSLMLGLAAQLPSIQTLHNSRSARSYQVSFTVAHLV